MNTLTHSRVARCRPHRRDYHSRCQRPARVLHCSATGGTIVREVLQRSDRLKLDDSEDRKFYDFPRFVTHVDDSFISQVTELYRQLIPPGGEVLDLMSSWVSHLPDEVQYSKVVGHGMNGAELARNRRLDTFFIRDLNKDPTGWALQDASLDAVVCCVSVQYMQQPEKVFQEIYRVLKPGGVCIITFSNRMFYNKAIQAWRDTSGYGRVQLVRQYFQCVSGFTNPEQYLEVKAKSGTPVTSSSGSFLQSLAQTPGPVGAVVKLFVRSSADPFYAVVAYRNFKPSS